MPDEQNFIEIFNELKSILQEYEHKLTVSSDTNSCYLLNGGYSEKFKQNLNFGSVQIKKNYVSFHLMPVYMYKDLGEQIPALLRKRMQGKSCFNFKKLDPPLFAELKKFTQICFDLFQSRGDNISMNC